MARTSEQLLREFPRGTRVIESPLHRRTFRVRPDRPPWQGTVVGYGRTPGTIRVRIDGRKQATTYGADFWQHKWDARQRLLFADLF